MTPDEHDRPVEDAVPPAGASAYARRRRLPARHRFLIGAVVLLAAVAVVGVVAVTRGTDDGERPATTTTSTTAAAVGVFGTLDDFDREDTEETLGALPNGTPWSAEVGRWGIEDGAAFVADGAGEARSFAIVGLGGQTHGAAQVRMSVVAPSAGLAFRYRGPYNYWAVVAVPEVATWNVIKVVDGEQDIVGNTGERSPMADGTTVAVRLEGDRIEVVVNGELRRTLDDPFLAGVGRLGLTARGETGGAARWDDFVVALPGNRPLPPTTSATEGGSTTSAPGDGSTTSAPAESTTTTP